MGTRPGDRHPLRPQPGVPDGQPRQLLPGAHRGGSGSYLLGSPRRDQSVHGGRRVTGQEHPTTGRPVRSIPLTIHLAPAADWRTEWCTTCKAWSRLTGSLLLTTDGVAMVGAWSWCEFCEDPADGEGPARA